MQISDATERVSFNSSQLQSLLSKALSLSFEWRNPSDDCYDVGIVLLFMESRCGGGGDETDTQNDDDRRRHEVLHRLQDTLSLDLEQDDNVIYAFGYGSGVFSQQQQPVDKEEDTTNTNNDTPQQSNAIVVLVDAIVVVRDALLFHQQNMRRNPQHYSYSYSSSFNWWKRSTSLTASDGTSIQKDHTARSGRHSQSPAVAHWMQRHTVWPNNNPWLRNPGLYFIVTPTVKFGIVQDTDLVDADLRNWSYLYLAGRMHKPILPLLGSSACANASSVDNNNQREAYHRLILAQETVNLPAALSTALLLSWRDKHATTTHDPGSSATTATATSFAARQSPTSVVLPAVDLYQRIASLSYTGDPRMELRAEDPNKVRNLVVGSAGQLNRFARLYQPALSRLVQEGIVSITSTTSSSLSSTNNNSTMQLEWDSGNPKAHARLWQAVPASVRRFCRYNSNNHSDERMNNALADTAAATDQLPTVLRSIVAPAARYQSIKGLWTAGLGTSAQYVLRKLSKGLLRRKPQ